MSRAADSGMDAVHRIARVWQVDEDRVIWSEDGFDWWPGSFKVSVSAVPSPPNYEEEPNPAWRIVVRTALLKDVRVDLPEIRTRISLFASLAPTYAMVYVPPEMSQQYPETVDGTVWLQSSVYVRPDMAKWLPEFFARMAILQPIDAQRQADVMATMLKARQDVSAPEAGGGLHRAAGDTGVRGQTGETGQQGRTGVDGPRGNTGAKGADGLVGFGAAVVGDAALYWPFRTGSGSTVEDMSASGSRPGGLSASGVTWVDNGYLGKTLSFDGTGYVESAEDAAFFDTDLAFEAFIICDNYSAQAWNVIFSMNVYPSFLRVTSAGYLIVEVPLDGGSGTATLTGATVLQTGRLYHVAVSVNATEQTVRLYLDGVQDAVLTSTVMLSLQDRTVYVGRDFNVASSNFRGIIDEVRFYDRPLTMAEVLAHSRQVYLTGEKGVVGVTGAAGRTGSRGETGVVGAPGATGPVGYTGPRGETGVKGATGPVGDTGLQGKTGPAGYTGPRGETGVVGAPGQTGPQGYTGPRGETGAQGSTGLVGDTGPQGRTGIRGETGVVGAPGDTGPQGKTGAQGVSGPRGDTGVQGVPGDTGPQGKTGPVGYTGPRVRQASRVQPGRSVTLGRSATLVRRAAPACAATPAFRAYKATPDHKARPGWLA